MSDKSSVDKALDKYLPKKGKLAQAMRYSIFAGGKRFRPLLCFAAAEALGKNSNKVISIAAAIEMIHTFTLIHDDLPSMDNSNYRRGKLTSHKKFDEATALLAGDALNTLAFEILAKSTKNSFVIEEISHALMKVVEGQVLDLASASKNIGLKKLKEIHNKKTAALIRSCLISVAIDLKATKKQLKALTNYANHLGLAFQIHDDILDVTSTSKKLGKPAGADKEKGFPYYLGVEKSKKLAVQEKNRAVASLKIFGKKSKLLVEIAEFVINRGN